VKNANSEAPALCNSICPAGTSSLRSVFITHGRRYKRNLEAMVQGYFNAPFPTKDNVAGNMLKAYQKTTTEKVRFYGNRLTARV
jgi:hypothetical protein